MPPETICGVTRVSVTRHVLTDGVSCTLFSARAKEASSSHFEVRVPEYRTVSGEDAPISVFHAHAFDAVNMLLDAVEEVAIDEGGTLFIPRTALKDAIFATSGFEGITGTLTCDENGDCADAKISVSQLQDGEYVRLWP
jgi:branched-chain amino acid transport system substrate-binding protein